MSRPAHHHNTAAHSPIQRQRTIGGLLVEMNMFIHFFKCQLPCGEDYRTQKEADFIANQGLQAEQVVQLDLQALSLEPSQSEYTSLLNTLQRVGLQVCSSRCEKVFLAFSCLDVKALLLAVRTVAEAIHNQIINNCAEYGRRVEFIVLEDLFYLERSFVYENKHSNFLRHLQTMPASINTSISSTNEVMNVWGEGDCKVVRIPQLVERAEYFWKAVMNAVPFEEMMNQGNAVPRLISIQSRACALGRPLYRHPHDAEPKNIEMLPITLELMELVQQHCPMPINHVLIQHYRDGKDNIAVHSDKTLDVHRACPVMNLSLGSTRDMFLQSKRDKRIFQKVPLRHGECFLLGLKTNQFWFHEVPKDVLLKPSALFGTGRISFTFRSIASYWDEDRGIVLGQGSPYKTIDDAARQEAVRVRSRDELIAAFSKENKQFDDFSWEEAYGEGFLIK